MGDLDDDEPRETMTSAWGSPLGFAERYRDLGYGPLADKLRAGGPPRGSLLGTPVIVDVEFGGYPHAATTLGFAAASMRALALVILPADVSRRTTAFVRRSLAAHGHPDVPIVAGADLDAIASASAEPDVLRWVGLRQPTTLSQTLRSMPELAGKLAVTQFAGKPGRRPRVFGRDLDAATHVLDTVGELLLVTDAYNMAVVVAAAQEQPCIDFSRQTVTVDPDGQVRRVAGGHPVWIVTHVDRSGFGYWLDDQFTNLTAVPIDETQAKPWTERITAPLNHSHHQPNRTEHPETGEK
ncbi:hypothetical protein IU500_24740 [Nocardia terpenica]|uniref:hypothetical protein n=1 Tax=Nocardia terpenica TaxID=455432 RepID=UPI00189347F1|nr:hypothetical protein [Nocardia terpenica]MBF6064710.1 hypothetical protein [Nocardia terpenica]MBF6107225.1 hypothetical protein [Nocardia terpenica]MBF6114982.1 hypothetical protein [Nocardia terpenica]MBF6122088.1 hypothetical protein [Nocardia terpenica]MBF6154471.1 hypothetical protein [Nocardia terpenica]